MSIPKYEAMLKTAIDDYMVMNGLCTDYRCHFGTGHHYVGLAVSDLPADYDPELGLMQDGPEYRLKPVLYAYLNPDGTVRIEETEFTNKYLYKE